MGGRQEARVEERNNNNTRVNPVRNPQKKKKKEDDPFNRFQVCERNEKKENGLLCDGNASRPTRVCGIKREVLFFTYSHCAAASYLASFAFASSSWACSVS